MPEGKEEEQEIESLFEKIMKENFPNLVNETDIQVQEAQRVPNKLDPKRVTPRHVIIKMPKVKDREIGGGVGEWVRGKGIKKYKWVVIK